MTPDIREKAVVALLQDLAAREYRGAREWPFGKTGYATRDHHDQRMKCAARAAAYSLAARVLMGIEGGFNVKP